jgi:hypothetical protein
MHHPSQAERSRLRRDILGHATAANRKEYRLVSRPQNRIVQPVDDALTVQSPPLVKNSLYPFTRAQTSNWRAAGWPFAISIHSPPCPIATTVADEPAPAARVGNRRFDVRRSGADHRNDSRESFRLTIQS